MLGLNPWLIIVGLCVVLGIGTAGYLKGHADASASWQIAEAKQEKAAAAQIEAATTKLIEIERQFAALKDQMEKDNADQTARINGLRLANGRLVAAAGGLFDRNGRARADGADRPAAGAAAGPAGGAAGCELSGQITQDLLDLARDADLAAAYGAAGYAYGKLIEQFRALAPAAP